MNRKIETLYTEGMGLIEAVVYENGHITATADEDKVTEFQLLKALKAGYPNHVFTLAAICGRRGHDAYYIVDGKARS